MRYDTSEFPGVKAVRLDDGRVQVDNDGSRAFFISAGLGLSYIVPPGATKIVHINGDTFSMGWHHTDQELAAAGEPRLDPASAWPFPSKPPADDEGPLQPPPNPPAVILVGSNDLPAVFDDVLVDMVQADSEPFEGKLALTAAVPPELRHHFRDLVLGDVVGYAHKLSMLTAEEWNALGPDERERQIANALTLIRGIAAGPAQDVEALAE